MENIHIIIIALIAAIAGYFLFIRKFGFISFDDETRILLNIQDKIPISLGERKKQILHDISLYNDLFRSAAYNNNKTFSGARNLLKNLWSIGKYMKETDSINFKKTLYDYNFSLELLLINQYNNSAAVRHYVKVSEELRNKIYMFLDKLDLPL